MSKQYQFHFVVSFMGECCTKTHLWAQSVMASSEAQAKRKVIRAIQRAGNDIGDIVRVSLPNQPYGPVEEADT